MNAPVRIRDEDAVVWRPKVLIKFKRKGRDLKVQADSHVALWNAWSVENRAVVAQWPLRIRRYLIDACRDHRVLAADILGPRRHASIQPARRELAGRLKLEAGLSYPTIARYLRRKDHTTAVALVRHYLGLPRRGVKS